MKQKSQNFFDFCNGNSTLWKIYDAYSITAFQVDHNDCDVAGNLSGGALMKMADEVAALAASKHSLGGTPTTVAMDAVNFNKTIPKGFYAFS